MEGETTQGERESGRNDPLPSGFYQVLSPDFIHRVRVWILSTFESDPHFIKISNFISECELIEKSLYGVILILTLLSLHLRIKSKESSHKINI